MRTITVSKCSECPYRSWDLDGRVTRRTKKVKGSFMVDNSQRWANNYMEDVEVTSVGINHHNVSITRHYRRDICTLNEKKEINPKVKTFPKFCPLKDQDAS